MQILAAFVHVFTALGAVCALFATDAIFSNDAQRLFIWLAIALFIDGIDGTFARAIDVKARLPRFSGERLDLVIDYVTYVFVPVLALLHWKYLDGIIGSTPPDFRHKKPVGRAKSETIEPVADSKANPVSTPASPHSTASETAPAVTPQPVVSPRALPGPSLAPIPAEPPGARSDP